MDEPTKPAAPAPTPAPAPAIPAPAPQAAPVPTPAPATSKAVRMTSPARGREAFPSDDPRAGAYEPGIVYLVPEQLAADKAAALVDGGGYEYCART